MTTPAVDADPSRAADLQLIALQQKEIAKLRLLLDSAILGAQTEFIDWAAMNRNSPDHVPGYKPDYPQWLIDCMEMRKSIYAK